MPDKRRHRGPHPEDIQLFASSQWHTLQLAVSHLAWLLTRRYAGESALKLVGDRFQLQTRQRLAVQRSTCSDQSRQHRAASHVFVDDLRECHLQIDGFNLLTTVEAALSGGVLLRGRDGCLRDMASVHGSYRRVEETEPALRAIGAFLASRRPAACTWWFDRPVSNSGRVSELLTEIAQKEGWPWQTRLVPDPDRVLRQSPEIVVTADSVILDHCLRWTNLAWEVVDSMVRNVWVVPLQEAVPDADP
ncbi:MAG: DUF434 domain-containing protein [Pirellulaceae bacterium]